MSHLVLEQSIVNSRLGIRKNKVTNMINPYIGISFDKNLEF